MRLSVGTLGRRVRTQTARRVAVAAIAVVTASAGFAIADPASAVDERIAVTYIDTQLIGIGPGVFRTQRSYRVTNTLAEPVAVNFFGTNSGQQGGGQPPFCINSSDSAGGLVVDFASSVEVICNFAQAYRGPSPFGGTPTESWPIAFTVRPAQSLVRITNRQAVLPAWGPWFGAPTLVSGTTDTYESSTGGAFGLQATRSLQGDRRADVIFTTSIGASSATLSFLDASGTELTSRAVACTGVSCVLLAQSAPAGAVVVRVRAGFPSRVTFTSGSLDSAPAAGTTVTSGPRVVPTTTTTTTAPTTTAPTTIAPTTTAPTTTLPSGPFSVSVSPASVPTGGSVAFAATGITPASGRVDFTVGGIAVGTALVNDDGTARLTNTLWSPGVLPVVATHVYYVAGVPASKTATTTITVGSTGTTLPPTTLPGTTTTTTRPPTTLPGTTTTTLPGQVTVSVNPSSGPAGTRATITVSGLNGTGRVEFSSGRAFFGSVAVTGSAASLTVELFLPSGPNPIRATWFPAGTPVSVFAETTFTVTPTQSTTTTLPGGVIKRWTFTPGNTDGWISWFVGTVTAGSGVLQANSVAGSYASAQTTVTGVAPGTHVWLEGTIATAGDYNVTLQYYTAADDLISIQRIPLNDAAFAPAIPDRATQIVIGVASTASFTLRSLALHRA